LALKGYGFSDIHADEYSVEGWKSAKLKQYHPIEWQCACLNVNADALDEIKEDSEDDSEQKKKAAKYFKIGKAIAEFQESGNKVYPPNVNKAKREFSIIDNKIMFGLKGLVHVGDEAIAQIVSNRPYTDIKDFYTKNCWRGSKNNPNAINKPVILSLIKCGAFDFYNPNRKEVFGEYIQFARIPTKEKKEILDFSVNDYQPISKKDYEAMIEILKTYNKYQWEFDATNYFFSGTPFDILKKIGIAIYNPKHMPEREEIIVYGTVLGKEDRPEKKYVYIVTAKGILKLRVYLNKWNQYKDLLQRGTSIIVKGAYNFEALTVYEIKGYFEWITNLKNNLNLNSK
jgi:DNA polymerase-3 subunit alpha